MYIRQFPKIYGSQNNQFWTQNNMAIINVMLKNFLDIKKNKAARKK